MDSQDMDLPIKVTVTERLPRVRSQYSDVYVGRFGDKIVAVKYIEGKSLEDRQQQMVRERKLLGALDHPNIVPFYGYDIYLGPIGALIFPWYENGDAGRFLEAHGDKVDVPARSTMWMGVVAGVHYLHTQSPVIVHGNLNPDPKGNILIDEQGNARLSGFGTSRMLIEAKSKLRSAITIRYLSRELSEDISTPTTASDVHALACIGLEFIHQQPPYAHRKNNFRIFQDIEDNRPPAVRPSSLLESLIPLWDLFESCWSIEPANRPTVENVMASHKKWHAAYYLDLPIEVTVTDPRPRGGGGYSDVYIGQFGDKIVAVKSIKTIRGKSLKAMQRKFTRERKLWAPLDHPNIVPFYGYAKDEEIFGPIGALISPWYENGDAAKFLAAHGKDMDVQARSTLWMGVIAGVHYLHTYSPVIVHGDLKPGNILIDEQRNARLCDFGISRELTDVRTSLTTTSAFNGTVPYLSRELVDSEEACTPTTASDVYALACIGLEIIHLRRPYASRKNGFWIFQDIANNLPPDSRPSSISESLIPLWDLFESCWSLEPAHRPQVENIMASHKQWHATLTYHISKLESEDTEFLIAATKRSFKIIAPLFIARSDHGAVHGILNRIRDESAKYFFSVRNSVETAQSGYLFARKVQELRSILAEEANNSDKDIHAFIREIQGIAEKAHATAKATANMFRANRQEFAEIRASSSQQIAKTVIYLLDITVPESGVQIFKEQAKNRRTKAVSCKKGLERLELAEKDLEQLILQMDILARYWLEMNTTLHDIETRVEELRDDHMLQMSIWGLNGDWAEIARDYQTYEVALNTLLADT